MERLRIAGLVAGYTALGLWLFLYIWDNSGYLLNSIVFLYLPLKLAAAVGGIIFLHKGVRGWAIAAWTTFILLVLPYQLLPVRGPILGENVGPFVMTYDGWYFTLPPQLSLIGIISLLQWLAALVALAVAIAIPSAFRETRKAEAAAKTEAHNTALAESQHAQRVAQIAQWEAAYRDAHNGDAPPAGYVPPMVVASAPASERTNVMAILALVLSFFMGVLGIVFGHIALSQVKQTGERGRGLAIAGLVIGYVTVGFLLTYFIVFGIVLANAF